MQTLPRQRPILATELPIPAANQAFPHRELSAGLVMDPGYVTDKENEFRLRSAECQNHASKAPNDELRQHFLWLAEMWHELAEAGASFLKLKDPSS